MISVDDAMDLARDRGAMSGPGDETDILNAARVLLVEASEPIRIHNLPGGSLNLTEAAFVLIRHAIWMRKQVTK